MCRDKPLLTPPLLTPTTQLLERRLKDSVGETRLKESTARQMQEAMRLQEQEKAGLQADLTRYMDEIRKLKVGCFCWRMCRC